MELNAAFLSSPCVDVFSSALIIMEINWRSQAPLGGFRGEQVNIVEIYLIYRYCYCNIQACYYPSGWVWVWEASSHTDSVQLTTWSWTGLGLKDVVCWWEETGRRMGEVRPALVCQASQVGTGEWKLSKMGKAIVLGDKAWTSSVTLVVFKQV